MSTAVYEDDRPRRRDRACVAAGLTAGAALGAMAGAFTRPGVFALVVAGAVVGGIVGRLIAPHISSEEWDPRTPWQPFVGASSPDDDIPPD